MDTDTRIMTESRTVRWSDPMATRTTAATMSGLDFWRAVADGRLAPPPIGELMRMRVVKVEPGDVTFDFSPDASMYNPLGMVHGGAVCTLLDTVAGSALHTALPAGMAYTSIEIKVNYLRPVTIDGGDLRAVGTLVKKGSRVGFTEGAVCDAVGNLVATASSTLLIFDADTRHSTGGR